MAMFRCRLRLKVSSFLKNFELLDRSDLSQSQDLSMNPSQKELRAGMAGLRKGV